MPNRPRCAACAIFVALSALAGCGAADIPQGINDPYEDQNRAAHEFNKSFDRSVLRPVANAVGELPQPVLTGISNFARNAGTPANVLNDLLQAKLDDAAHNTTRFLVNTTIGIIGIVDFAYVLGLKPRDSDFGETLHVWGAVEGHYVELPAIGPSTKRDAVGKVVDTITNPLRWVLMRPERNVISVANGMSGLAARHRYGEMIDYTLYGSEDSYAETRRFHLETRRCLLAASAKHAAEETVDLEHENRACFYRQIHEAAE